MRGHQVEFHRVCIILTANIPGEFDDRSLQPQADTEEGYPVLPCISDRFDLSGNSPLSKATRYKQTMESCEDLRSCLAVELVCFHIMDVYRRFILHTGMLECLNYRLVGIEQIGVLASYKDRNLIFRILQPGDHTGPAIQPGCARLDIEHFTNQSIESLLMKNEGYLIDTLHISGFDYGLLNYIAEEADLGFQVLGKWIGGTTEQDIGLDTDLSQFIDAVLGRFRFQFTRRSNKRNQRHVDEESICATLLQPELSDGFQDRKALNITDSSAYLGNDNAMLGAVLRQFANALLYFVCYVRDNLNRASQIVSTPLLLDYCLVDLPGRGIVFLRHVQIEEPFIVTQVEIGFGAVIGNVYLTVLEGIHCPGVNINVGIQLQDRHVETASLQKGSQ